MTDKKTYSDPSRSGGSESEKSSPDRSPDRDREKNLGSRHGSSSPTGTPGSAGHPEENERESSSDRDR